MADNRGQLMDQYGLVPVPDPTKLTTDAVAKLKDELINIIDIRLAALEQLLTEKFKGVATEFTMRDIALSAAFKAAEAAVTQQNTSNTLAAEKAASAFTKQIDALDEKINDLKERLLGLSTSHWSAVGGYIVGAIGVVLAITLIGSVLFNHH
jgi:hypothetical protein